MNVFDFFSSPIGLGHVTRDIAIANYFQNYLQLQCLELHDLIQLGWKKNDNHS